MQQFTISFIVFGLLSVLLSSSVTSASVINCPPRNYNYQEFDPRTNKLCSLIEQALTGAGQERECNAICNNPYAFLLNLFSIINR